MCTFLVFWWCDSSLEVANVRRTSAISGWPTEDRTGEPILRWVGLQTLPFSLTKASAKNISGYLQCKSNFKLFRADNHPVRTCLQRQQLRQNTQHTLQRHYSVPKIPEIFPEKESRGFSVPIFMHSAAGKFADRSWEYINRLQTHECGNCDWGRAIPFLGLHKWDFRCSASSVCAMKSLNKPQFHQFWTPRCCVENLWAMDE